MARTSTYLNFTRNTEEAFNFYKSIFGGEFGRNGIARFRDIPPSDEMPPLAAGDVIGQQHQFIGMQLGPILAFQRLGREDGGVQRQVQAT